MGDRRLNVGVLMGGISSERDVSVNTGNEIINHLDKNHYHTHRIMINDKKELIEKVIGMDLIFIALHGRFGEDGTVQAVLETLGIPYTGCGILASVVCMNKDISKKLMKAEKIPTPEWAIVSNTDEITNNLMKLFQYPVVVKPNTGGSSVATYIVNNKNQLFKAVSDALKYDSEVMVEQYIKGSEITCSILNGQMLPIIAIKPKADFFDYTSKYSDGGAEEVVVELKGKLQKKIEDIAVKCYKLFKCTSYARIDIMIKDDIPYVLEVNTLPGMTKNSLMPKSAQAAGLTFDKLLDSIIETSLRK